MESCDIAEQIVEAIAGNAACRIHVDSMKLFHDLCMIRNRIIRDNRITEPLKLDILRVILADRD